MVLHEKKSHVDYVINFVNENLEFVKFFKHSLIPDEHFFHTVLLNSNIKDEIVNDNLGFLIWNGSTPITFSIEDAEKLKDSDKLFARKFDVDFDFSILDLIDKEMLN